MSREWRLGSGAVHLGRVYVSQEKIWLWSWHTSTVVAGASQSNLEYVQPRLAMQWGRPEASWNYFPWVPHPWIFRVSSHHWLHYERAHPTSDSNLGGSHHHLIFQVLTSFSPRHFSPHFSGYEGLQLLYLAMLVLKNGISTGLRVYSCLFIFRKF